MRWVYSAALLAFLIAGAAYYHSSAEIGELRGFCEGLPLGMSIADVRETAEARGFEPAMEPHAQMRIKLSNWNPRPVSCRVFFNNARTIEYRKWEGS